ncbi:MAG: hypothetical protein ACPICH_03950, partial [Poseidonia sp.]
SDAAHAMRLMWEKLRDAEVDEASVGDGVQGSKHGMMTGYLQQSIDEVPVVLCSDMGTPDQAMVFTTVGELDQEEGGRLNCLVFPASTGDIEEKALARWKRGA